MFSRCVYFISIAPLSSTSIAQSLSLPVWPYIKSVSCPKKSIYCANPAFVLLSKYLNICVDRRFPNYRVPYKLRNFSFEFQPINPCKKLTYAAGTCVRPAVAETSLPDAGKGGRLFSGTRLGSLVFHITSKYHSYWLTMVILAGSDRLPALSTAMTVNVFSPLWVAYKMVRSPLVVWSRTPFWYTSYSMEA